MVRSSLVSTHLPGSTEPPHARSKRPFESNYITEDADRQQSTITPYGHTGPSSTSGVPESKLDAARSSLVRIHGRWTIQTLSSLSTAIPGTCPINHKYGSTFGQDGSTEYFGASLRFACATLG